MSLFDFWKKKNPIDDYLNDFLEVTADAGLRIRITEVERSARRQRELYAQGRTRPGREVTWTLNSQHTRGRAFDFTVAGAPEYDDAPYDWEFAIAIGEELGLHSGASYQDFGHLELRG